MAAADELTIESLRPGDAEARWRLGRQAFGATADFDPARPVLADDQVVAAYVGEHLVGAMVTLDFVQTWGGRGVPCGGLSGVVVAPEARGRGIAKRMLAESFARMGRRGQVVSSLYPTTATLYRSVGYEVVCWYGSRRIPLGEIPTAPADALEWHRLAVDGDLADVVAPVEAAMVAHHDGWFVPDPRWRAANLHSWAGEKGVNRFAYVGRRDGRDVAVVVHRYTSSDASFYDLEAELLVGVDGPALAAALAFLAGHGTTAGHVRTTLPAPLLATVLPNVQRTSITSEFPLMVRIVDAAGAVAARGWPAGVTGRVELAIDDPFLPANDGAWVLELEGGKAMLSPGGAGRVRVTAPDLARLYAGTDPRLLQAAGRLPGAGLDDVDLLLAGMASSPSIANFF